MAKQGLRAHKALSTGRLAGPNKVSAGKKRAAVRKAQCSSVYSTDSEDQVVVIHKGLDRCAALLKDILHNEDAEKIHLNQGKVAFTKAVTKSLMGKGNLSKKKVPRKHAPASHVHKEIVSSLGGKAIPGNTETVNKLRDTSPAEQNPHAQQVHMPNIQHSPVMPTGLCEQVQTQMSLMKGQIVQATSSGIPAKSYGLISDHGSQGVPLFNYRLPSSTPALSPQRPATPAVCEPNTPVDIYNQNLLPGGAFFPVASNAGSTVSPRQPVSSACDVMSCMPATGQSSPCMPKYPQPVYQTETLLKQASPDQKPMRDSEILCHIQAQLSQLQQRNMESQRVNKKHEMHIPAESDSQREEESSGQQSDGTSSDEENFNRLDVAPVRDTSCQTSFDKNALNNKRTSPHTNAQKLNKVKYLLAEIKALASDQDDTEVQRLTAELEEGLSMLPVIMDGTNIHADIALALQPLRSENAQLRRRLRILNQQLRERERVEKESRSPDFNFELISLQSMNITLQNQLSQSQKSLELLQGKNEELLKVINDQKEENKMISETIHEREQELLQSKQQAEIETAKVKIEGEEALSRMKNIQFKLEASEKENNILAITLRQRDAEVHRLRELTRTLQGSMTKLLSDLSADKLRSKPGNLLTTSLLKAYEKQLQNENCSARTSIMSYLKKLEPDTAFADAESQFSDKIREAKSPDATVYENLSTSNALLKKLTVSEEPSQFIENCALLSGSLSPISSRSPSKYCTKPKSDSCTLIDEDQKLDETMYIPFASSPSKTQHKILERRMCTPTRMGMPPRSLDYNNTISGFESHKLTNESNSLPVRSESSEFTGNFGFKNKVPSAPELMECQNKFEDWLPAKSREKMKDFPAEISGNSESLQPTKSHQSVFSHQQVQDPQIVAKNSVNNSSYSTTGYQPRNTDCTMSSFSTFTSHDEQDFRDGLADLDANIARLQRTLQANFSQKFK
ncbi:coiled-coil domain-containing protein 14 [Ambystoma mexicanum]|uniref:coiled-coil domain-containing protein 14 n=1 Tax=Ambystoma mexicanum TaxID=8296 RepID=UPI0037E70BEA